MPRKPLITDRERTIIAMVYNAHKNKKAEAIRILASKQCGRELGLSTVQRELAKLRQEKTRGSFDPLDDQWSLASIKEYPIPAATIPLLLYIQSTFEDNVPDIAKKVADNKGHKTIFLTNRLAVWISRLQIIAESDPNFSSKQQPSSPSIDKANVWPVWIDDLVNISMFYSNFEIGCELSHTPFNTVWFDAPSMDQIKRNIILYLKDSPFITGIYGLSEEEKSKKLGNLDALSIIRKGAKHNARPHNKKR